MFIIIVQQAQMQNERRGNPPYPILLHVGAHRVGAARKNTAQLLGQIRQRIRADGNEQGAYIIGQQE
ncbi:MAG: hypothetical protein Q8N45_10915 [Anaerolineales bacterium]|nr:hypothetical protein [Anaerolineales bacterium]MDP2976706.1 hypothetical protein [Anaerolineales bacterium]